MIKEKIATRKLLVREYKKQAAKCRDVATGLSLDGINVVFDENGIEPVACVKTKIYQRQDGEVVMPVIKTCEHFGENQCPVSDCPYHSKYEQYKGQEKLLTQAKAEKRIAFKRIFQRIK